MWRRNMPAACCRFAGGCPRAAWGRKCCQHARCADFAARSFINHWRASGGEIADGAGAGRTPAQAATLAANQSKPLAAVLADMNKESNNRDRPQRVSGFGRAGRARAQRHAKRRSRRVRRALRSAGLDDETLVLENGSGLSRRERASARFRRNAGRRPPQPVQTAFTDSLPIAGNDGTLKKRFQNIGSPLAPENRHTQKRASAGRLLAARSAATPAGHCGAGQ